MKKKVSITKIRVILIIIIISLVLGLSNVSNSQSLNKESSKTLNTGTVGLNLNQNEIKTSGDNEYVEIWSSTEPLLRNKELIQTGSMDKDGKKEIIIETIEDFYVFEYNATYENYTLVWTKDLSNTMYAGCIGDQDGDGKPEILGGGSGEILSICEYSGSDNDYISVRNQSLVHYIHGIGVGEDLDKDGKKEIIIGGWNNTDGYKLNVYEFNGTDDGYSLVWTSAESFGQFSPYILTSNEDLDFDGRKEIICCDSTGKVYIYEHDGTDNGYTQVWNSGSIIGDWVSDVEIGGDLDGDGKKEIIASSYITDYKVYVFEYNGTDNCYNKTWDSGSIFSNNVKQISAGTDLDGDGKKEIIAGSDDDNLVIFEYNGTDDGYSEVWRNDYGANIVGLCIGEDHNGNGKMEIMISTGPKFYIYEHDDSFLSQQPINIIKEDDDDDDGDDEDGIFISNQTLIIAGAISAIILVGIVIILIKRKTGSGR